MRGTDPGTRNQVAMVTGTSSGIGRAVAGLFLAQGINVALVDVNAGAAGTWSAGEAVAGSGAASLCLACDCRHAEAVAHAVQMVRERFGRLDILVNCAGIFSRGSADTVALDDWRAVIDTNLTGYLLTMHFSLPVMLGQGSGVIVNVSSIHGLVGTGQAAAYCASKGAVENLTRQVAVDYGGKGIRCNAVAPGVIVTPMSEPFRHTASLMEEYQRRTILPRLGTPLDVAYAVRFLASDEASFITGATLVVDGGWTCW